MSFTLNTRKLDDVVIVDMSGRLTIGEAVLLLRNTTRRFIEDGTQKFILNLGGVSHIDSAGLGELISIFTSVRNRKGDVKLLNLDKKAKDLLQMTKLLTVFDTYSDEAKALEALK
jgi:anti-sigma B factor antagonist